MKGMWAGTGAGAAAEEEEEEVVPPPPAIVPWSVLGWLARVAPHVLREEVVDACTHVMFGIVYLGNKIHDKQIPIHIYACVCVRMYT